MKKPLIIIAIIVLIPFWFPWSLRLFGYYTYMPGWRAAESIVEAGKGVSACKKVLVMPWEILSPGGADQRFDCIHTYAKLTKDPSACELLMPSSYGLNCVGAAEDFDPCIMLADEQKSIGGQGIDTTYESCLNGSSEIQNHICCAMAQVLYADKNDCHRFPEGALRDQCHHIRGVREKNLDECNFISNERNRVGCEVVVRAYQTGKLTH